MPASRPLAERFHEKVDRRESDECWPWTAGTTGKGYGQLRKGAPSRRMLLAHRISYELVNGPITKDLQVLHSCDNPPCVNPKHLFLGTVTDNMRDMEQKGRGKRPDSKGEKNGRAKLTVKQVAEVRRDYVRGSHTHGLKSLAKKYGVHFSLIGFIVRGECWQ